MLASFGAWHIKREKAKQIAGTTSRRNSIGRGRSDSCGGEASRGSAYREQVVAASPFVLVPSPAAAAAGAWNLFCFSLSLCAAPMNASNRFQESRARGVGEALRAMTYRNFGKHGACNLPKLMGLTIRGNKKIA
jgi:hypothetical protein